MCRYIRIQSTLSVTLCVWFRADAEVAILDEGRITGKSAWVSGGTELFGVCGVSAVSRARCIVNLRNNVGQR